jgi:internalin A
MAVKTPEEIATELILKSPLSTTVLNLNDLGLTAIPVEISRLKNLVRLNVNTNKIEHLPKELFLLSNLEIFTAHWNEIKEIPSDIYLLSRLKTLDVSFTRISEVPSQIGNLSELLYLDLSGNLLPLLPPEIGKLSNLRSLLLYANKLDCLPAEVGNLKKLEHLDVRRNRLSSLSFPLGRLKELRVLDMGFNYLSEIPEDIGELEKMEKLSFGNVLADSDTGMVGNNKISTLPIGIKSLINLSELDLRLNPLSIPPEILDRYNNPRAIINYYFSLTTDSLPRSLNETKIVVIGQPGNGKTSVVKRILGKEFLPNENITQGIDISHTKINGNYTKGVLPEIKINIWDFGGQEIMHATHQFFLTKRSLYLLVVDSRLTQEENRVEYWLKIIQSFGGGSPVLIVGNKIDQHPLDIDRTGLQKKYPNIVGVLETSAATGTGIEELKAAITEQVNNLPHVRDLLPETWFTVKTKLEELGRQSNFITHDKYLELCAENQVSDETSQRTLIGFLHDLGVVLHFQDDPRLEALGILNPQWVTNGVYKILNSHTLFQNKGVLTTSMLDEILNLPEYPRGKRLFIIDMMKKFELCYDIESDKTFLVPDLLPKDEPAELKFNGVPAFEYAYPVLPSSVITRFIVRLNQKIENHFVWRTGVVLKIGENLALVKADIEDRKITIAIDGVEHTRRDALSAIRYQLDEIHGSIKGLDAQKRVPIPNAPNAEPLEYETLLMLEREGQEEYLVRDGKRLVKVNVREILSGVVSETERRQSAGNVTQIYIGGDVNTGGGDFSGRDKSISAKDGSVIVGRDLSGNAIAGDENEVK